MRSICIAILVLVPAAAAAGVDTNAVVRIVGDGGACSATIVSADGVIVSAEHCECARLTEAIFRDGTRVAITQIYEPPEKQGRDEVTVMRITAAAPDGGWPFIPVATRPAAIGTTVTALGYPGGKWRETSGRLSAATERIQWVTNIDGIEPGISGGPLVNSAGELVGVCSGGGGSDEVGPITISSGLAGKRFVAWHEIRKSLAAAGSTAGEAPTEHCKSRRVIIFTTENCDPCRSLKSDIKAGHFKQFDTLVCEYDHRAKAWQDPAYGALFAEFYRAATPTTRPGFPIIWVEGTREYREGYEPDQRGGLLGFLQGVFRAIGRLIVGESRPVQVPILGTDPAPAPVAVPAPDEVGPATEPEGYRELRTSVSTLIEDLKDLKSGNVLEKLGALRSIRDDLAAVKVTASDARELAFKAGDGSKLVGIRDRLATVSGELKTLKSGNPVAKLKAAMELKGEVAALRADAQSIKEQAQRDPWLMLYGLPGLLTGLLHRRMAA